MPNLSALRPTPLLPALLLVSQLIAGCGGGGGGSSTGAPAAPTPGATSPAASTTEPAVAVTDVALSRYALWSDELTSTPVTVEVLAPGTAAPEVSYFDGLVGGSGAFVSHTLRDDGSRGDAVAGDGVWTLSFTLEVAEPTALRLYDGLIDVVPLTVRTSDRERTFDLGVVSRTLDGTVSATTLDATTVVTDALVNLVMPGFDGQALAEVTERLYEHFPSDPFDFLIIFHSRPTGDGVPRSLGVRNAIEGINLGAYDSTAAYGSAGRLQQVVFQNASVVGREVNHELGHRWGAFLDDPALNLSIPTGFHWGASEHVGQMGNGPYLLADDNGGYLATNANGSEQFVANAFSMLELYLMGLADPAEVAPLRFVTDPDVDTRFGTTIAEADTRVVSIDDIVSVYGARAPARANSPTAFTAAVVVVSDASLTAAEHTLSTHVARYLAGSSAGGARGGGLFELLDPPSFAAATRGRATLHTQLP